MNVCIFRGNIANDPEIRYSQGEESKAIARFSLAVQNPFNKEKKADFFQCVSFNDKQSQFIEEHFKKGMSVCVRGRAITNNYTNKNGEKVYGVSIVLEEVDFASNKEKPAKQDGFQNRQVDDMPFN